jgi:hypothetical protein
VLRAAGETETTQGNIRDWLQLDEGEPGFQLLTEEEIAAVIYFYVFLSFFVFLRLSFASLTRMTSPAINPDYRGLTVPKEFFK